MESPGRDIRYAGWSLSGLVARAAVHTLAVARVVALPLRNSKRSGNLECPTVEGFAAVA